MKCLTQVEIFHSFNIKTMTFLFNKFIVIKRQQSTHNKIFWNSSSKKIFTIMICNNSFDLLKFRLKYCWYVQRMATIFKTQNASFLLKILVPLQLFLYGKHNILQL